MKPAGEIRRRTKRAGTPGGDPKSSVAAEAFADEVTGVHAVRPRTLAEQRLQELESVFSALAHEQRRHILLTLHYRGGGLSAGDISRRFACSWPTTSRHLRQLEEAELVLVEKRGRERWYRLNTPLLKRVVGDWLGVF